MMGAGFADVLRNFEMLTATRTSRETGSTSQGKDIIFLAHDMLFYYVSSILASTEALTCVSLFAAVLVK